MSENPIYDGVASGNESDAEAPKDQRAWLTTESGRRWLYGIAATLLVVVAGYFGISAAEQESWLNLVGAILNIGGAGALTYANRKVS